MEYRDFNFWAKDHILNDNMFDDQGNIIMENTINYKKTGKIACIFEDHWNNYLLKYGAKVNELRPNADKEVQKMLKCFNHELGASVFECPDCNEIYFCHHTCKGKFCSSCGSKTQKVIAQNILEHCYNCNHRQIVFTIPRDLWFLFFDDFYLINLLFDAVRDTLYSITNGKIVKKKHSKKKKKQYVSKQKWTPGFFSFLHTYGRDIKWNPHIHVIIAEMKLGSTDIFKKMDYFNYDALSKRFQKIFLDKLEKHFGKNKFAKIKNNMFIKYKNGFYVYAEPKKFNSLIDGIMYVARYGSHPAISENRILNYDGENVTFCYNDHKDNVYHEVTVPAFHFITLLIKHIAPKGFKVVRYYGFYNKKHKFHDKIVMLLSKEQIKFRKYLLKWNNLIAVSFNRIALECPNCGISMHYLFEVT